MYDPLGVEDAFDYMDDACYLIFDYDYPEWEDDIYYNLLAL